MSSPTSITILIVLCTFVVSLLLGAVLFLFRMMEIPPSDQGLPTNTRPSKTRPSKTKPSVQGGGRYDYNNRETCCNSARAARRLMFIYAIIFGVLAAIGALVAAIWGIVEIAQNWHHANCSNWASGALQAWFILFALPLSQGMDSVFSGDEDHHKKGGGYCLAIVLLIYGIVLGAMGFCDEVKEETKLYELYLTGMSSIGLSVVSFIFFLIGLGF